MLYTERSLNWNQMDREYQNNRKSGIRKYWKGIQTSNTKLDKGYQTAFKTKGKKLKPHSILLDVIVKTNW